MGTINYRSNDYITIGYNCNYLECDDDYIFCDDCRDQVEIARARYFIGRYFSVTIEPGYYEGFYIDIGFNYSYCFDSWEYRRAAQKEVTQIKAFLLECISFYDLVSVYPGWCTSYADYEQTQKDLNAAIFQMRETVRNTPTWSQLEREKKRGLDRVCVKF